MDAITDPSELSQRCDAFRRSGLRVGFVPTMGYLHEGHLSLVRRARELSETVVVSIFVNPKQFGPGEDLERYPRDLERDRQLCAEAGVAVLFVPEVEAFYPAHFQTHVEVERLSAGLCGGRRPGHFRGVCTVVTKLFHLVGRSVAVFGEKDYQQLQVIRQMVEDLCIPVEVAGSPIVRESDGLAMSSRNRYLAPEQRQAATCLYRALDTVRDRLGQTGELDADEAVALARELIEREPLARVDYVELRRRRTLESVSRAVAGEVVLLLAAFVGETRLIDNLEL